MTALTFTQVEDESTVNIWMTVHNKIIPSDPLTVEQVESRSRRNVLDVAHLGGLVVGCSTVRPATDEDPVTVIVRILPAFRRRGFGAALLAHALAHAQKWQTEDIQTIVLASNLDGLEFALRRGFVESDRYTLDGDTVAYVHLATSLDDVVRVSREVRDR